MTVLTWNELEAPFGPLAYASEGARLVSLAFGHADDTYVAGLVRRFEGATPKRGRVAAIADRLDAYFAGELRALDAIEVEAHGTPFQESVWTALRTIAVGETCSYAEIARRIAQPKAMRAVGMANNRNPIAIVVPCHRVIGADGSLTGFGGGLPTKRWLLAHEGVLTPELPSLA